MDQPAATAVDGDLLGAILRLTRQVLGASRCSLMLPSARGDEVVVARAQGLPPGVTTSPVRVGDGVAGWVALHRCPVLVCRDEDYPELLRPHRDGYATPSFASVPVGDGELLGILNVADKVDGGAFTTLDLSVLSELAAIVAGVLRQHHALQHLRQLPHNDDLTGLPNRRSFQARLAEELDYAARHGRSLVLLLVDLDHFHHVVARCGQRVADSVLQAVASAIASAIRRSDSLARYDGTLFALVLPGESPETIPTTAQRIARTISAVPLPALNPPLLPLRARIGLACYPDFALDAAGLFDQADAALRAAHDNLAGDGPCYLGATRGDAGQAPLPAAAPLRGFTYVVSPADMLTPELARLLPPSLARRLRSVPVAYERHVLTVAMADPTDRAAIEELAQATHLTIHPTIADPAAIDAALAKLAKLPPRPGRR